MQQETAFTALSGGLDLITPPIAIPAGRAIAAMNYEPIQRGYGRVPGFERYDGRPEPHKASYWTLGFDAGSAAISEGDVVTGGTSGATGIAVEDATVAAGSWAGSDAAGTVVLYNVVGAFQDNEALQVSAATVATADGVANERGALTDAEDRAWQQAAIAARRSAIGDVPGSGPVRGLCWFSDALWAFRDNAGGTAGVLHKATAAGWVAQALGYEIAFTGGGTYEIAEGDTITGATSAATATVGRVIVTSGTWAGGDAAGRLILTAQTGTFQAETLDVGANLNVATVAGDSTANALPAGGRYRFRVHNFTGRAGGARMYGAQGEGRAFEWDGTVFVSLDTGMGALDKPRFVAVHREHLFFGFDGGSIQWAGTGEPYDMSTAAGAGEFAVGSELAEIMESVAGALVILATDRVAVLFGNDASDFELQTLADDAGGRAWTAQQIGTPIYLDDRGLRTLEQTQAFGNFQKGTLTRAIEPLLQAKKDAGVTPTASLRVRAKDQYRLFFSDGTGITLYMGREAPEALPFDLGIAVYAVTGGDSAAEGEILFFASTTGRVYRLDVGTSFDGEPVEAYLRLPFSHIGTPQQNKRWIKASLEVDTGPNTQIGLVAEYGYGDPDHPPQGQIDTEVSGGGGFWDVALWNRFHWSAPAYGQAEAPLDGYGRNMSLGIVSTATHERPHVLHGVTLFFSYRGLNR